MSRSYFIFEKLNSRIGNEKFTGIDGKTIPLNVPKSIILFILLFYNHCMSVIAHLINLVLNYLYI